MCFRKKKVKKYQIKKKNIANLKKLLPSCNGVEIQSSIKINDSTEVQAVESDIYCWNNCSNINVCTGMPFGDACESTIGVASGSARHTRDVHIKSATADPRGALSNAMPPAQLQTRGL